MKEQVKIAGKSDSKSSEKDGKVRERIKSEAFKLFSRYGYSDTSIEAICRAARVTKPMVYYYFGSKEGLYEELVREAHEQMHGWFSEIDVTEGTTRERLERIVSSYFKIYRDNTDLLRFLYSVVLSPRNDSATGAPRIDFGELGEGNREIWKEIIDSGVRQGELRQVNFDEVAIAIMGIVNIYCIMDLMDMNEVAKFIRPRMEERITNLLMEGIKARKGGN